MNTLSFFVAILAGLAFAWAVYKAKGKDPIAWGLLLLTVAWVAQLLHPTATMHVGHL